MSRPTLVSTFAEVHALRDAMGITALNSLAMTCRDMREMVPSSDTFRREFCARHPKEASRPKQGVIAPSSGPAILPKPEYRTLCHGMAVYKKQYIDRLPLTDADHSAARALFRHLRTNDVAVPELPRGRRRATLPPVAVPPYGTLSLRLLGAAVVLGTVLAAGTAMPLFFGLAGVAVPVALAIAAVGLAAMLATGLPR